MLAFFSGKVIGIKDDWRAGRQKSFQLIDTWLATKKIIGFRV